MYHKTVNQHDYQALLVELQNRLDGFGVTIIKHLRLSIEHTGNNNIIYQGLAYAKKNNQPLMLKWALTDKGTNNSGINAEINALQQTAHAKVITLIFHTKKHIQFDNKEWLLTYYAMPYRQYGDVKSYLNKQDSINQLSFKFKQRLILAMAQSLLSLHDIGWIHGDIKPSNFLINTLTQSTDGSNDKVTTQLCDLSHAVARTQVKPVNNKTRGTPAYLAPECWQGQPITIQSDIYAFGVTVFEILTQQKPYQVMASQDSQDRNASQLAKLWATTHCQTPIPYLKNKDYLIYQTIIDKLLAKRIKNRYQSMQAVLRDLG